MDGFAVFHIFWGSIRGLPLDRGALVCGVALESLRADVSKISLQRVSCNFDVLLPERSVVFILPPYRERLVDVYRTKGDFLSAHIWALSGGRCVIFD